MTALSLVIALLSASLTSQVRDTTLTVTVSDSAGRAIPYAQVTLASGASRVADDTGRAVFKSARSDSIRVLVRRIGFQALSGWLHDSGGGRYAAILTPLPQNLARVDIFDRNTALARRGFYDRMERVRRGATSAWFMTPEEIELRNPGRVSHLVGGQQYIKLQWYSGRPVLTGRSGSCQIMVLLDGVRLTGMLEEAYTPDGQREIARLGGGERGYSQFMAQRMSIDDVVNIMSVQAVEVYANAASAPVELQRAAGSSPCGIIAIWTGGRP